MRTFYAEHDTRPTGWGYLISLIIFTPLLVWALQAFQENKAPEMPKEAVYFCVSVPFLALLYASISLILSRRPQSWMISEKEIAYTSSSPALGKSLRINIADFRGVELDGDSDFAFCISTDGSENRFHLGPSGGNQFYEILKEEGRALRIE